jgi:hypothetical protein
MTEKASFTTGFFDQGVPLFLRLFLLLQPGFFDESLLGRLQACNVPAILVGTDFYHLVGGTFADIAENAAIVIFIELLPDLVVGPIFIACCNSAWNLRHIVAADAELLGGYDTHFWKCCWLLESALDCWMNCEITM